MISELAIHERSFCDCNKCRQFCHERPGALAPSDIDRIAEHEGFDEATDEFILSRFEACTDGPGTATEEFPDGKTPVIRPQRKPDGSCVFLNSEGRCSIHKVAPFECKVSRSCQPEESAGAMKSLGNAIRKSRDYCMIHFAVWNKQEGDNA